MSDRRLFQGVAISWSGKFKESMTFILGAGRIGTLIGFGRGFPVFGGDDRQTDLALLIDIRVVDSGQECDLRWLERVLGRELHLDSKRSLAVRLLLLQMEEK